LQFALDRIFFKISINQELLSHSSKTAYLCWEALQNLPRGFINLTPGEIYLAGLLHDIGKTTWPPGLFYRPKQLLTCTDRLLMNSHPLEGVRIAREMLPGISNDILKLIETHHERPGGTGYPAGITRPKNEALLLAACDVFCACTEWRQYRKEVLATGTALKVIKQFAPPEIVRAIASGQRQAIRIG